MLTLSLREKATLGFHACGSCPKEKTLRDSSAPRASKCATHLPAAMRICGWYVNQLSPIGSFPTSSFLPYLIGPFSIFPDWFISQSLTPLAKLCNPAHRLPYLNPCSPWFSGSSSLGPFEEAERVLRTLPTKTLSLLLHRPEGSAHNWAGITGLRWNHWVVADVSAGPGVSFSGCFSGDAVALTTTTAHSSAPSLSPCRASNSSMVQGVSRFSPTSHSGHSSSCTASHSL